MDLPECRLVCCVIGGRARLNARRVGLGVVVGSVERTCPTQREGNVWVGQGSDAFLDQPMVGEANISVSCYRRNVIRWSS